MRARLLLRLRRIAQGAEFVALILTGRLLGRLPIPARYKDPVLRWIGVRAFLVILGQQLNARRTPKLRVVSEEEVLARLARPRTTS